MLWIIYARCAYGRTGFGVAYGIGFNKGVRSNRYWGGIDEIVTALVQSVIYVRIVRVAHYCYVFSITCNDRLIWMLYRRRAYLGNAEIVDSDIGMPVRFSMGVECISDCEIDVRVLEYYVGAY